MPLYRRPGSPYWWVSIGRKTRKSTGTDDREAAEEFERVLTQRLWRINKLGDRSAISWNEATERWLNESARPRKRDRELIAWLKPRIGAYSISDVAEPDTLEELRKIGLKGGWAHSTVDRMMRTVRAVLKAAHRWRCLESVPAIPMYGEADEEPRFLTAPEFKRLCTHLPPHLELATKFAVLSLLRMRAQSQLVWSRVDLKGKHAWVPGRQQKTKSTFGFPLSPPAIAVLKKCRANSPVGDFVFQYDGKPVDNFHTKAFKKAAAAAGVEWLRWHDLRHTGASWAVQSGVPLTELMVLGGWKSYRSVLRYAHLAPSNAVNAARRVAGAMSKKH